MRIEKQMLFQASVFLFRYLVVKVGFHIHFEGKFFLRFPHKKFCWRREYPRIKWDSSCSFRIISVLLSYVNSAGAGLAPQAGAGPSFLDEKKGSKDSPRGEFRFSPPWNPHSMTKGAAFGNREKLPLWCFFTHRHSLRVKQVRKGSFPI